MIELLNQTGLAPYVPWILLAGIVLKVVTLSLPPPTSNGWYNWVYTFFNTLMLNVGKGKNFSATEVPGPASIVASGPVQSAVSGTGEVVSVGGAKK